MARRAPRRPVGIGWIITWPLTAVLAAAIFLCSQELSRQEAGTQSPPRVSGGAGWEESLGARIQVVTAALEKSPLGLRLEKEEPRGAGAVRWTHRTFEAVLREEDRAPAEAEIEALRRLDPGLTISSEATFSGTRVQIGLDGLLTHTLRFRWANRPEKPQVAIVVTQLGDDLLMARRIVDLDAPVALAIRPFRPFSKEVSNLAHMFKREILLEIADAPSGDGERPGKDEPRPGPDLDLGAALASVPDAVGVLDESPEQVEPLAERVRERGLFFLNAGTVDGPPESGTLPVVSLDTTTEGGFPAPRVEALFAKARSVGYAVGVGLPSDTTVAGVRALVEACQANDIDVVSVATIAGATSLSQR